MKLKNFVHLAFCSLVITLSFLSVSVVSAQQPTPSDDEVNAIARQLFCPICQNTPLDVCPTQACHDWRELIRQMLAQGKTPLRSACIIRTAPERAELVGLYCPAGGIPAWRFPAFSGISGMETKAK
jgi:hypothetical protein